MPTLVPPTPSVRRSFLAAMNEFRAEERLLPSDRSMVAFESRHFGGLWGSDEGFGAYVGAVIAQAREDGPVPSGWVPCTTLWLVEGPEYLGRIVIRHRLTTFLREVGGHIGYDVRPSARRRGHATRMLRDALPVAYALGIDPVLITCDDDNLASRRVIELNGGVLEDIRDGKMRFWAPTKPASTTGR